MSECACSVVFGRNLHSERRMYTDLLRGPQSNLVQPPPVGPQSTPVLLRAHYPQISYWTQKDWTSYKASVRQGGVMMPGDQGAACLDFIESVEGATVSTERISGIRRAARELFISIQASWETNGRNVPATWGAMSHGNKDYYRRKMKEQFPELALCEGDWKCEYVATQTYSGWYRTYGQPKVKQEPGGKKRSKKTANSFTPTPVPDNTPEQYRLSPAPVPALGSFPEQPHLPPTANPSISTPISDSHPNLHYLPPTGTTLSFVASPVTPILGLEPNPLNTDSPTAQGADHHNTVEVTNPTWGPTPLPESQLSQSLHPETLTASPDPVPPIPTDTALSTTPPHNTNRPLDTIPSPHTRVEAIAPNTPTTPLERETTLGTSIQVRS